MPPIDSASDKARKPAIPARGLLQHCARLRFAYDRSGVRLRKVSDFARVMPPLPKPAPRGSKRGTWVELIDSQGAVLWTKSLGTGPGFDVEMHGGGKVAPSWIARPDARGVFEVVAPLPRGVAGLRLFTPPLRPGARREPAELRLLLALDEKTGTWREKQG